MSVNKVQTKAQQLGWPAALVFAAVAGSLVTSCMMPFVGLAVVAAWSLPWRSAVAAVGAGWVLNQMIGFGVLHYPWSGTSVLWGVAVGVASFLSLAAAWLVLRQKEVPAAVRLVVGSVVAFTAYEGLLYGLAIVTGGRAMFTRAIVGQIGATNAGWLLGLMIFRLLLERVAPESFGQRRGLRLAQRG